MPSIRVRSILSAATAIVVLGAGVALATPAHGPAAGTVAAPVFLWPKGATPPAVRDAGRSAAVPSAKSYNDLIFHGGAVEHDPHVYLIFWGAEWKHGFRVGPNSRYASATVMRYETLFFRSVGGSAWHGTQSQFCDNIAPGSVSCAHQPLAQHIVNHKNLLRGVWVDPSPAPKEIVTSGLATNAVHDPLATEAVRAARHFGYGMDSTYMIFTPPGHGATAYGSVYCAYHSEVTNVGGHGIKYAFMPFTPEQGVGCGGNSVNATNNAFGNGYLDSYTLAGGHEFEEAVTDPDAYPFQDGWNDYQTSENGDKCAYFHAANIRLGGHDFAVQPMWSNEANAGAGGCAMHRGKGKFPVPPVSPV